MYPRVLTKTNIQKKEVRIILLFIVLFVVELLVFTWVRTKCLETGYKISELNRKNEKLVKLRGDYILKKNQYRSHERIGFIAEKYVGLKMPAQDQIILLE